MIPLYRSWGIPLIIYGILIIVPLLLSIVFQFVVSSYGDSPSSLTDRVPWMVLDVFELAIGALMIRYGLKLRAIKIDSGNSAGGVVNGDSYKSRINFYFGIAIFIIPFFLLHWNGFLDFTYYWYLHKIGAEHEFRPQLLAAVVSTLVICGVLSLIFEIVIRRKYRNRPNN